MYSIVLMAALTGSADLPDRHGCSGCSGGCYGGCYASCSCSGRGHGHHRRQSCCGCSGYSGCYGGGCYGGYACSGYGGCYGGGYGGCYGGGAVYTGGGCYWGCSGAGNVGAYASPYGMTTYGCAGGLAAPAVGAPGAPAPGTTLPAPGTGRKGDKGTMLNSTGTILVTLPADATLTVDGNRTTSTSATRVLVTPELQPGYEYYYTLRAQVVRDGQTLTQTQQIAVRAGEATRVPFSFSSASVASSR